MDVLKRSWGVIVATALVFALAGYLISSRSAPSYQGAAQLLVGTNSADPQALQAAGTLGRTYADLATTRPVIAAAIAQAGVHQTVQQVLNAGAVTTSSNDVTRILEIDANAGDPATAARFANAIAYQLQQVAAQSSAQQTAAFSNFQDSPGVATAAPQARAQILLAARQLLGAASSARLTSVNPATPPTSPASPKKTLTALLAGVAGLLLAALVVLIREGTGRRGVKDERELTELETAGFVGSVDTAPRSDPERALPVRSGPQSKAADRYRTVATNMAWLNGRGPLHTLLVVSPDEEAQAGVVAANLAAVLAEANRRVVLVDAAAKQSVSKLFYLDGHPGYGEVLDELADGGRLNGVFDKHLVRCGGALEVLPRGKVNGRALLDADAMDHVRSRFLEDADVLVVTAPSLADSPAALAWSRVTDATLVVVNKGRTARANLEQTLDGLTSVGAGQVGTVFVRRPSLRA